MLPRSKQDNSTLSPLPRGSYSPRPLLSEVYICHLLLMIIGAWPPSVCTVSGSCKNPKTKDELVFSSTIPLSVYTHKRWPGAFGTS